MARCSAMFLPERSGFGLNELLGPLLEITRIKSRRFIDGESSGIEVDAELSVPYGRLYLEGWTARLTPYLNNGSTRLLRFRLAEAFSENARYI